MKKLFFLASALLVAGTMSVSARTYVQTGKEGDPKWDTNVIGADATVITFSSVADLPKTGEKEIWFAGGTYVFDATFSMEQYGMLLAGGFKGTETALEQREWVEDGEAWDFVNETVLDGQEDVKLFVDTKHTSFDGLTMQGSYSTSNAGICRLSSSPDVMSVVRNCKCLNNEASNQGGCFQVYNSSVLVENSYFEGNIGKQGGALYINATAETYELTVRGCYFKGNEALHTGDAGGAVHAQGSPKLTVTGCMFEGNTASKKGQSSAISCVSSNAASLVANNVFVDNVGTYLETENTNEETGETTISYTRKCAVTVVAGDVYYNTFVNNLGGALWSKGGNVKNNVFWAAESEKARVSLDAAVVPNATNNAGVNVWAEGADASNIIISMNNTPAVGDEEGTLYAYFTDPENHDFDLQAGSALIKAGVAIETITTDIDGEERKNADIGAYAYDGTGTAVENIAKPAVDIRAALQAGEVYNILGQRVSDIQPGNIYIVSGQKMLVR